MSGARPANHDALRLSLRGVSHASHALRVFDGIDLDIPPGEVTVLVGPSGCGKSTLLCIMGGLLAPAAGEVRCEGIVAAAIALGVFFPTVINTAAGIDNVPRSLIRMAQSFSLPFRSERSCGR